MKRWKAPRQGFVEILRVGQFRGVHIVHTSGVGLGRIPHVSAGVLCLQGLESGSSPTSGTCFPYSGACGPLSVHKLFTCGSLRGPFLLVAAAVAGVLLANLVVVFGTCYLFIVVHGVGYMTGSGCESLLYFAAQRTFTMWTGSDGVQPASQSVLACSRARTRGCAL